MKPRTSLNPRGEVKRVSLYPRSTIDLSLVDLLESGKLQPPCFQSEGRFELLSVPTSVDRAKCCQVGFDSGEVGVLPLPHTCRNGGRTLGSQSPHLLLVEHSAPLGARGKPRLESELTPQMVKSLDNRERELAIPGSLLVHEQDSREVQPS
jgi:hypothetical protein